MNGKCPRDDHLCVGIMTGRPDISTDKKKIVISLIAPYELGMLFFFSFSIIIIIICVSLITRSRNVVSERVKRIYIIYPKYPGSRINVASFLS